MKKQLIVTLLLSAALLTACTESAEYTETVSETTVSTGEQHFHYSVSAGMKGKVMTVRGEGEIPQNYFSSTLEYIDASAVEEIVFSEGITVIGKTAFANLPNLKKITISATVMEIGEGAFSGCSALESVTFANPQGWMVSDSKGSSKSTNITIGDTGEAATFLKETYANSYWHK